MNLPLSGICDGRGIGTGPCHRSEDGVKPRTGLNIDVCIDPEVCTVGSRIIGLQHHGVIVGGRHIHHPDIGNKGRQ